MNSFKFEIDHAFNPLVMAYLKDVKENSFSYNNYELRHPGAIYNLTTTRLIESIIELITKTKTNTEKREIYSTHRLMLYNLFKFYDACYEIMMCFTNTHCPPTDSEYLWKWLLVNGYPETKDFFNNLKSDIDYLRILYNKLKHTSNELRYFSLHNNDDYSEIYSLELPNNKGGVYLVNNPPFPISFNFEFKRIHFIIYRISEELLSTIKKISKRIYNIDLKPSPIKLNETIFEKLFFSDNSLSDFYFPTEVNKAIYRANSINENGVRKIHFSEELISKATIEKYYLKNKLSIEAEFSGDGFTREFSFIPIGIKDENGKFFINLNDGSKIEVVNPH